MSSHDEPSVTDLELFHRVETEPPGTFKLLLADGAGVEERIRQHLVNIDELTGRIRRSVDVGCLIETISLRFQVIDYWLRIYFVNHAQAGERKKKFGELLRQCQELQLDDGLCGRLRTFNRNRIDAIHGYVVGATSYSALVPVVEESDSLLREVVVFVVKHSGHVVTSKSDLYANPGAITIHVDGFCNQVQKGLRY